MKNKPSTHIVGIVENQSSTYVRAAFAALTAGELVVPLRAEDDAVRIDATGVDEIRDKCEVACSDGGWFRPSLLVPDTASPAYVSFTSGTEGLPKAVFISGLALNNTIQRLQAVMKMDGNVKEYIGVPVYHSFGFGRCRHVASVGGSCYIPKNGFDPRELSTLLLQDKINALSLVPSLLRVLIQTPGLLGDERCRLLWLEIGSQAMTVDEKKAVRALFPNATIVQHYGLTEASRTTLLSIDKTNDDSVLSSVGRCYGDSQIRINESGRICIRGAHLASRIQQKQGEKLALVNKEGWFETSDLGRLEDDLLYFLGRADSVVNCGGQKLSSEILEAAISQRLVALGEDASLQIDIAISKIEHPVYGEGFLLSYVSSSPSNVEKVDGLIRSVAMVCLAERGISAKNAIVYQCVAALPKTTTGKVLHRDLVRLYREKVNASQAKNAQQHNAVNDNEELVKSIVGILGLPLEGINMAESVGDVGIDSLQTVRLSIILESALGYLPSDWRDQPLDVLISLSCDAKDNDAKRVLSSTSNPAVQSHAKVPPLWDGSSNRNPDGISFFSLLKEDYITHDRHLFSQGLFAVFVNRFGNWRMGIRAKVFRFPMSLLYRILRKMAQIVCGIKLDYTVQLGRRVKLEHFGGMILGAKKIGDDTIIRQNTTFGIRDMSDLSAKPIIENGVNIAAGVVIVGNVVIGRHSVIGPNCVIGDNVPPFSVVSVTESTVIVTPCSTPSNTLYSTPAVTK